MQHVAKVEKHYSDSFHSILPKVLFIFFNEFLITLTLPVKAFPWLHIAKRTKPKILGMKCKALYDLASSSSQPLPHLHPSHPWKGNMVERLEAGGQLGGYHNKADKL